MNSKALSDAKIALFAVIMRVFGRGYPFGYL